MKNQINRVPSWLKTVIKATLAFLLIYWVIQRGGLDFGLLLELFIPTLIIPCLLLTGANIALVSERWRWLIVARGVGLQAWPALKLTLIGNFFNFAMPGAVGGDVIKGYYLARNFPGQRMMTALSVLVDRLIGFYAMLVMALAVMFIDLGRVLESEQLTMIFIGTIFFFLAFNVFFLFAFSRRNKLVLQGLELISSLPGHGLIEKVYKALHVYGSSKKVLLMALFLSFAAQFCSVLFFWWVGQTMEQMMGLPDVPFLAYIVVVPLGFIVTALPLAPAGIGVGQAAFLFLFNLVLGYSSKLGATAVTLFQISLFFYGIFGALIYLRQRDQLEEGRQDG